MRLWTASEEEALARMVAEGIRQQDIGKALGRSTSAVCSRVRDLGLQSKRKGSVWSREELDYLCDHYLKDGMSAEEIGARLGRSVRAVYHKAQYLGLTDISHRYNAAPKDAIQRMVVMISMGATIRQVADELGVSGNWVSIHLDERPALKRRWLKGEAQRRSEGQTNRRREERA